MAEVPPVPEPPTPAAPPVPPIQSRTGAMIAYVVVGGFFLVMLGLFFVTIPSENVQMVNLMVGAIIGYAAGILNYHYGSSAVGDTVQLRRTPTPPEPPLLAGAPGREEPRE